MENSAMETTPSTSAATTSTSSVSADPMPPATSGAPPALPTPASSVPSTPEIPSPSPSQIPNPNPVQQQAAPKNPTQQPIFQSSPRPHQAAFSNFSSHLSASSSASLPSPLPAAAASLSSPVTSSLPAASMQRGGVVMGVPSPHARPPQQQPGGSFSGFGHGSFNQFGGLGRGAVAVPETMPSSNMQVRPSAPGGQSMGMMSPFGTGSQVHPGGPGLHHHRPGQPPLRAQTPPINQALPTQKFQSHTMTRLPSVGSSHAPSLLTTQGQQTRPQSWMTTQGKQTLHAVPSPSYRPAMKTQNITQRSQVPHPHQIPMPTSSGQNQISHTQQQQQQSSFQSLQSQEHYSQQHPPPKVPQSMPHQQQVARVPGSTKQKSLAPSATPAIAQAGLQPSVVRSVSPDGGNKILSKRSILEIVTQIDPSEKLDPEVVDVLADFADDFVETITTYACSLAKHRKSTTLEAKDILLHLERNWHMTLPGFWGEEIKGCKKQSTNEIHRERLAAIKKSIAATEATPLKGSAGQAAANPKGHAAKTPSTAAEKT